MAWLQSVDARRADVYTLRPEAKSERRHRG
jgi:hypothetical protein